jgi:hypothetical protein
MNAQELKLAQVSLEKRIYDIAKVNGLMTDKVEPITDGVYDAAKYLAANRHIMWVMKEPYDEIINGEPFGGEWNLARDCFAKSDAWSNRSWQPIIYAMYGLNHGLLWDDMDWIRDDKNMANILQEIAYINVSKMPGNSVSSDGHISKCYMIWKPILFKQISIYNPDVIIFANTFKHFKNDMSFGLNKVGSISFDNFNAVDAYKWEGKLLLDVYHPNNRTVSKEVYVNSIIEAINSFEKI